MMGGLTEDSIKQESYYSIQRRTILKHACKS